MTYSFTTFSQIQRYLILTHLFHFFLSLDFTCGLTGFPAGEGFPVSSEDGWFHRSRQPGSYVHQLRLASLSALFSFRLAVVTQGRALGLAHQRNELSTTAASLHAGEPRSLDVFQASKEWKVISSYAPDSDVQVGSKVLLEVPLEDVTGVQKRTFNVDMYKVSFVLTLGLRRIN